MILPSIGRCDHGQGHQRQIQMPKMRQALFNGRSLSEAQEHDSCLEGRQEEGCQEESRQEESQAEEKSPKRPRCQASRSSPGSGRSVQTSRFDAGRTRPVDHRCSCCGTTEDGRVGESPEIISRKSNSHNACMDVGWIIWVLATEWQGPFHYPCLRARVFWVAGESRYR